jgi:hypothetical protein
MRTSFIFALLLSAVSAFVPQTAAPRWATPRTVAQPATVAQFKFLKELGIEKPSWLPDFGSKEEEKKPEPAPEPVAEAPEGEEPEPEAEAPAEE